MVRQWGNSYGVIIPKDVVEREHLRKNEKIRIAILRDNTAIRESFGILKFKKSAQQMKDEIRKDLYD